MFLVSSLADFCESVTLTSSHRENHHDFVSEVVDGFDGDTEFTSGLDLDHRGDRTAFTTMQPQ